MSASCTLKDIANELGITPSTVSRVLNGSPAAKVVSESMRLKIQDVVERMGYVPNVNARRLVKSKSNLIGIVLPGNGPDDESVLADRALADTLGGIEKVLKANGYRMLLIFNDKAFVERREYCSLFKDKSIDGMIVWGAREGDGYWCEAAGQNVVMISSRNTSSGSIPYVGHDNFSAGYGLARMLLEHGRRRLAYLDGELSLSVADERFAGYRKALENFGVSFDERICFRGMPSSESIASLVARLKREPDAFDAVQCLNDGFALTCGFELKRAGFSIPGDIMLAGGDRIEDRYGPMQHWQIPLMSFRPDSARMGRIAAQWILDGVSGSSLDGRISLLPVELVGLEQSL